MIRNLHGRAAFLAVSAATAMISCAPDESPTEPAGITEAPAAPEFAVAANSWSSKAPMPTARHSLTLGFLTNAAGQPVLFAFGGRDPFSDNGDPVYQVEAYNAATNTWTTKGRMPQALFSTNGVGLIGGKFYLPGGAIDVGDGYEITPHLWVYNPVSDAWTRKADLPRLASEGVSGVIGGKLYVLTGRCDNCTSRISRRLWRYDPATNRWDNTLPWSPQAHVQGVGGVIKGKFYVAGGIGNDGRPTNQLHVYDPATNRWTAKASMPSGPSRTGAAGVALGGKLYVLGGFTASGGFGEASVLAYDPVANRWSTKAAMPTGRTFFAAARYTLNGTNRLLAVGGLGTQASPTANESYTP